MKADRIVRAFAHLLFAAVLLGSWELASARGWINSALIGRPSGIASFLWENATTGQLWTDLGWSLTGTAASFLLGSVVALAVGLIFVAYPAIERFLEPYFSAVNVMPRIALAPLFILWFGLGIGSKIAVGFSLTFFIVLSSTVAGMRAVSQDHVTLCKTLGANARTMFFQVTLPGAVAVIFSGLRLGLVYALLGVIGAEIIASEKGLGQSLSYLSSTFNVNGVMALLLVLAAVGICLMGVMTRIERRLLHWQ